MNTKNLIAFVALLALLSTLDLQLPAAPLGTAFTHQGILTDSINPADGAYDLRFAVYDAAVADSSVTAPGLNTPVAPAAGLSHRQGDSHGSSWANNRAQNGPSAETQTQNKP